MRLRLFTNIEVQECNFAYGKDPEIVCVQFEYNVDFFGPEVVKKSTFRYYRKLFPVLFLAHMGSLG